MSLIKTNSILFRGVRKLPLLNNQITVNLSSLPKKFKSDVYVSICIERQPVIIQEKTKIEEKMQKILHEIEFEKSLKSNFELLKEGKLHLLKKAPEEYITQSAVDIEEKCKIELENFKAIPKSSDEKNNDIESKLSKSLFLLNEESDKTKKDVWTIPKDIVSKGETLKQAAKRILNEYYGDKFNAFLYGNAPIAYTIHKSKDTGKEDKVFYFLAKYESGSITTKSKYKWFTADELIKVLPGKIYKCIHHFYITSK